MLSPQVFHSPSLRARQWELRSIIAGTTYDLSVVASPARPAASQERPSVPRTWNPLMAKNRAVKRTPSAPAGEHSPGGQAEPARDSEAADPIGG